MPEYVAFNIMKEAKFIATLSKESTQARFQPGWFLCHCVEQQQEPLPPRYFTSAAETTVEFWRRNILEAEIFQRLTDANVLDAASGEIIASHNSGINPSGDGKLNITYLLISISATDSLIEQLQNL